MSKILRAMSKDGSIRAFVENSKDIVNEAIRLHGTTAVSTVALGRTLTAASLLGCMMKNKTDSVTLKIKSLGEIKNIICISDYMGNVRGYIDNPHADVPLNEKGKFDVGRAIGEGYLAVIKDMGEKEPFAGRIQLVSGEIAEDMTEYFRRSEQIPSVCALGVRLEKDSSCVSAGGLIVQVLPGADENVVDVLENNVKYFPDISSLFIENDCEYVMDTILKGIPYDVFDKIEVGYVCNCSRERTENALITLGEKDLTEIINDNRGAELCCHFCDEKYFFSTQELTNLLTKVKKIY